MKTTLNKIKEHLPCEDGWKKLLTFLNKTEADDQEFSLLTILESNGIHDALWALKTVKGHDKEIRLMACDFAESVVHLTNDERCVNAIKVSRDYANGLATKEELDVASSAAWAAAAAGDACAAAARSAAWAAARAAASYARNAVCRAARDASDASDASDAIAAEKEKQIKIFKKYVK